MVLLRMAHQATWQEMLLPKPPAWWCTDSCDTAESKRQATILDLFVVTHDHWKYEYIDIPVKRFSASGKPLPEVFLAP
ncbi:MAG TPA: hypothetical protein EYN70_15380 [Planctomycetaceae bacterium]|nr:hypothetical protein [Planctomycetaceae bacterium]